MLSEEVSCIESMKIEAGQILDFINDLEVFDYDNDEKLKDLRDKTMMLRAEYSIAYAECIDKQ